MSKIFISYTSSDVEFANNLSLNLNALGYELWFDQRELLPGDSIIREIGDGLRAAPGLIVILSPESVKSNWVQTELETIVNRKIESPNIKIFPVLYKECEIPIFLRSTVYADFRNDFHLGLGELSSALNKSFGYRLNPSRQNWECMPPLSVPRHPQPHTRRSGTKLVGGVPIDANILSGLWRGVTGRLQLSTIANQVVGKYDWKGFPYAGRIEGNLIDDVLHFTWRWMKTGEHGRGFFYLKFDEVLTGGWWLDIEQIDVESLVRTNSLPPHKWSFKKDLTVRS